MKQRLLHFLFSLSSFSGILVFLAISKKIKLSDLSFIPNIDSRINSAWNCGLILLIAFLFALFVLWLCENYLPKIDTLKVSEIKPVEGVFLPVYIGLFVIALELGDSLTTETTFLVLFLFILWIYFESVSYFNPFFLFFRYRFYEVKSENNISFVLITKQKDLKKITTLESLIRINNFTFMECEK